MFIRTHLRAFFAAAGILALAASVSAQTVIGSKHDLSTAWDSPRDVCAYCHTPHFANTSVPAPLWNRVVGPGPFQMYTSPTMDSPCPATPTGPSVACLGCHDGVVAYH